MNSEDNKSNNFNNMDSNNNNNNNNNEKQYPNSKGWKEGPHKLKYKASTQKRSISPKPGLKFKHQNHVQQELDSVKEELEDAKKERKFWEDGFNTSQQVIANQTEQINKLKQLMSEHVKQHTGNDLDTELDPTNDSEKYLAALNQIGSKFEELQLGNTNQSQSNGQGGNSGELCSIVCNYIRSVTGGDIDEGLDISTYQNALANIEGEVGSLQKENTSLKAELESKKNELADYMYQLGGDEEEEEEEEDDDEFGGGGGGGGEEEKDDAMDVDMEGGRGDIEGGTTGGVTGSGGATGASGLLSASGSIGTASNNDAAGIDISGAVKYEPKFFGMGDASPEEVLAHYERMIGTEDVRKRRKTSLSEKDLFIVNRIEALAAQKYESAQSFVEDKKKKKRLRPKGIPESVKGLTQQLNMLCILLMFILNGDTLTLEMLKDSLTAVISKYMYSRTVGVNKMVLTKLMEELGNDGGGEVTYADLHIKVLPTVVLFGPVTMTDPVSNETIDFSGRTSTTGTPNVTSELRYPDVLESVNLQVGGEVKAIVLGEKRAHADSVAEFSGKEDYPVVIYISAGGCVKDEAPALAAAISKKAPGVPIYTATDMNDGGLGVENKYEEFGIECIPLITPEVVEKSGVKFVGPVKERNLTGFQNLLKRVQKKVRKYGSPTKPVNIEELLSLEGGTHVGKLILRLVKERLEEMAEGE